MRYPTRPSSTFFAVRASPSVTTASLPDPPEPLISVFLVCGDYYLADLASDEGAPDVTGTPWVTEERRDAARPNHSEILEIWR
jgi:hypothetical protein